VLSLLQRVLPAAVLDRGVERGSVPALLGGGAHAGDPFVHTPPEIANRIVERYLSGLTSKDAGREFGVDPKTVLNLTRRRGHPVRSAAAASKGRRIVSAQDAQALARRYRSGESVRRIAANAGLAIPTVREALLRCGVSVRKGGMKRVREAGSPTAAQLYRSGYTLAQVGSHLGVSPSTIFGIFRKLGVPLRPRGRPRLDYAKLRA
jgi:DNA-binding CsgD family transcriptional regulator